MYVINSVDNTKLPYLDYNPDSNPNPRSSLDALREKQEGLPREHLPADSRERREGDGEDLDWEASSSWQRTDRCGESTLLLYMPLRRKGYEWVSDPN